MTASFSAHVFCFLHLGKSPLHSKRLVLAVISVNLTTDTLIILTTRIYLQVILVHCTDLTLENELATCWYFLLTPKVFQDRLTDGPSNENSYRGAVIQLVKQSSMNCRVGDTSPSSSWPPILVFPGQDTVAQTFAALNVADCKQEFLMVLSFGPNEMLDEISFEMFNKIQWAGESMVFWSAPICSNLQK